MLFFTREYENLSIVSMNFNSKEFNNPACEIASSKRVHMAAKLQPNYLRYFLTMGLI